ncbi:hypothetical protein TCAL_04850, partial [Tigriopus californicus]
MGHFCVVVGCSSKAGRRNGGEKLGFFRFPKKNLHQREQWIASVKRINPDRSKWAPGNHSRICSRHFLQGMPSRDISNPDYKPTIFPTNHFKASTNGDKSRYDRVVARQNRIDKEINLRKVQDKRAQRYIYEINVLAANMTKLKVEENSLLEKKRLLGWRKERLKGAMALEYAEKRRKLSMEKMITRGQTKDNGCQTDSGLHDFIIGSGLTFSCTMEGNEAKCEVLSPGYFDQGLPALFEVATDEMYVKSKPELDDHFDSNFSADNLQGDKSFKAVCGVSEKIFKTVLLCVQEQIVPSRKLSVKKKLTLFFVKLKHNMSYFFLGKIFAISDRYASEIFSQVLKVVFHLSDKFVYWIPQAIIKKNMPNSFKLGFPKCSGIIDASEVKIEAPSDIRGSVLSYSNYKAAYTLKFLICIAPSGFITFISKCYGGRVTDCHLTADSGFLELLRPGDLILADKGFPQVIEEAERRGAFCIMPPFCRGDFQLSEKQNRDGYQCSALRIHVEREIQRLKMFRILQFCEQTLLPDIDKILVS